MKYLVSCACVFALVVLINSCATKPGLSRNPLFDSSEDSGSKSVVFVGNLPRPDSGSMQTMIRLNPDSTYTMELFRSDEIVRSSGTYGWGRGTIILKDEDPLVNPNRFIIGKNQLIPAESKEIAGSEKYILIRSDGIIEVYWKLVELNGNAIVTSGEDSREPHLVLKALNNRIVGNGGCNGFSGLYELPKGKSIRFSNLISTKMACINITYENEFFNVLGKADSYTVIGDTLHLKRDTDVIAKLLRKNKK